MRPAEWERAVVLVPREDSARAGERRLVRAVAAAVLALGVLVPAGGPTTAWTPWSAVPAGTADRVAGVAPHLTRYDTIATETLGSVVDGDFTAATARFDPTVRKLLPAEALALAWQAYEKEMGRYRSHGAPEDTELGEFTVVDVPLRMERGTGEFRVTFHEDASIAGLFFLKAGVPAL
ncbi:DUF3887 domain-containing protein [Streptomyces sp. NPDC056367]|uniref:DUF3887 domain-containing protein n=1 Tax=Streptomyces sp. NPDC056367 TaxID=3345797 RepID=UPI0035E0A113